MKLGLGTVQFGLEQGRHNPEGRVSQEEAKRILAEAARAGLDLLDTAAQYGRSEEVLGQSLNGHSQQFKIITKTPIFKTQLITSHHVDQVELTFHESLQKLKREKLYGLLIHTGDLLTPGGERLYKRMESVRNHGLVEKIGVSVYNAEQIEKILGQWTPDIIQLPINVLDQRLIQSGHLRMLKEKGVELHARSVFLQGVLLDPLHLHPWFWPIQKLMEGYHDYLISEGLTPVEGALAFINTIPEIDYALVGVSSVRQLHEYTEASLSVTNPADFARFACTDPKIVNPNQWRLYE